MEFVLVIEPPASELECYGIEVPDIVGCFAASDTLDGVAAAAKEAIQMHLQTCDEEGIQVFSNDFIPQTMVEVQSNPEYVGRLFETVNIDCSIKH